MKIHHQVNLVFNKIMSKSNLIFLKIQNIILFFLKKFEQKYFKVFELILINLYNL
jgi:hypothetical protein